MPRILKTRPVPTEEDHRPTTFEVFFDLVFVFALTRITTFMAQSPTPYLLAQGLVLLLLFWAFFEPYAWLGNWVRADLGLVRAGMFAAMAAIFVAALEIPDGWRRHGRLVEPSLAVAIAYIVVRAVFLALYFYLAAGNRPWRAHLFRLATSSALSWVPLILGAMLGGDAQTALWTVAFLVDRIGARIVAALGGLTVRSANHMAERHGLVLIIALGESLVSVGAGAGAEVTRWPVLCGALLGLLVAFCLWWLYFVTAASPAGRALAAMEQKRRVRTATNAYSLTHFLLIAGIVYLALGVEETLHHLAQGRPGRFSGTELDWTATTALYGGLVMYLIGRILFLRFTIGRTPRSQLVAACVALALLPIARHVPALDALGLLTAFLVALVGYERISGPGGAADPAPPSG